MRALLQLLFVLMLSFGCSAGESSLKAKSVGALDPEENKDKDGAEDEENQPVAPKAPTGLTAVATVQGATLSWNTADTATKYILLRSSVAGSGYSQVYDGTARQYLDSGLTAGAAYYYVVQAANDAGTSPDSSEVLVKPLYPVAPAPATVAVVSDDAKLRVYWSLSDGAASYFLQRQTEGGAYTTVATGAAMTNYVDAAVVNGYRYGYRVQVANPDGALSSSTTATESPFRPGRQYCVPSQAGVHFFAAEAEVAAMPLRTITAPRMFTTPTDMAVTAATNRLYVLDSLAGNVALYDMSRFADNPISTPVLQTIPAVGATAVAVYGTEVYIAEPGFIRVYDSAGSLVRSGADARLVGVLDMAIGGGEIITVHALGNIHRWSLDPVAHVATITASAYVLAIPIAVEYVEFIDRIAILDNGGVLRLYNRDSSGAQSAVVTRTTYSDAVDIGYDSISRQIWVMREPGSISNTYAYDITALTQKRYFEIADPSPLTALEIDGTNGQFYVISGNNTIGKYGNYSGLGNLGQKSSDKRMVATVTGMMDPQKITVDAVNQQLYVRNKKGFLTVHSLLEGAASQTLQYTFFDTRGFNGDVAVYPAQSRMYVGETSHVTKFAIPFFATVVSTSVVNQSYSGVYNNLSLSTVDNRVFAFDADPDSWGELHIRGLQAVTDIRYNMAIYDMPPSTSTGTNVAYANFPGGGEVIAIDPENRLGWVFTPALSLKRTFTLDSATSTWASLVADPVNQELYVLRDGVVDVYNRNDLKGNKVAPSRSATLFAAGGVNTARDIELCR